MENLIKWLENKVHICIYLYIHTNILNYQSVPSPFPNRRIIESILSSLTHFPSMSPALGYTGRLLTTRNVCSLKSHGARGGQTSKQWRKEWVTGSSTEALISHLCQPSWLCSCCLLLNILSPTFHKKRPGQVSWVCEHWTWNYTDLQALLGNLQRGKGHVCLYQNIY